jgi:uncharacterized protein YukE
MGTFDNLDCGRPTDRVFLDPHGETPPVQQPFPTEQACRAIAACEAAVALFKTDRSERANMVTAVQKEWRGEARNAYDTFAEAQEGRLNDLISKLDTLAEDIRQAWNSSDLHNEWLASNLAS